MWVMEPTFRDLISIDHAVFREWRSSLRWTVSRCLSPFSYTHHPTLSRPLCRTLPTGAQQSREWVDVCGCAVTVVTDCGLFEHLQVPPHRQSRVGLKTTNFCTLCIYLLRIIMARKIITYLYSIRLVLTCFMALQPSESLGLLNY